MSHKKSKETHDRFVRSVLRLDLFLQKYRLGRVESHEHPLFNNEETVFGSLTIHAYNTPVIHEMLGYILREAEDRSHSSSIELAANEENQRYTLKVIPKKDSLPRERWYAETDNMISHILPALKQYQQHFGSRRRKPKL